MAERKLFFTRDRRQMIVQHSNRVKNKLKAMHIFFNILHLSNSQHGLLSNVKRLSLNHIEMLQ